MMEIALYKKTFLETLIKLTFILIGCESSFLNRLATRFGRCGFYLWLIFAGAGVYNLLRDFTLADKNRTLQISKLCIVDDARLDLRTILCVGFKTPKV